MSDKTESLTDRVLERAAAAVRANAWPLGSALGTGLLAHMFAFTNLLPNHDGVNYFFSKGGTADSGRWGLNLLSLLFPDYHLSWLYGILSLLMICAAACLIVRLFAFKSRTAQVLLPALIVAFPSLTAIFCYIFTSSCYAVSFLLAVLAACAARKGGWKGWLSAPLLLMLTLSIYQGFISLTGGLLLLLVVKDILDGELKARAILRRGLCYLAVMLAGMVLYGVSIRVSLRLTGAELNPYSNDAMWMGPGLKKGLYLAYYWFAYNLSSRYNMIVVSRTQRLLYAACLLIGLLGLAAGQIRKRDLKKLLLLLLCLGLLPLSICCMYVVVGDWAVHTIVLYGYVCLYVLGFLAIEQLPERLRRPGKDAVALLLTAALWINVCFANKSYLQLDLMLDNALAQSSTLLAQIRSLPGYNRDLKLAIYPYEGQASRTVMAMDDSDEGFVGVRQGPMDSGESEENFLRIFLGQEMEVLSKKEAESLARDARTADMPCYPDEGSIRILDDVVFVKISEPAD